MDVSELIEPFFELSDRVGIQIASPQSSQVIVTSKIRESHKTARMYGQPAGE